jgi:hypothetical protein
MRVITQLRRRRKSMEKWRNDDYQRKTEETPERTYSSSHLAHHESRMKSPWIATETEARDQGLKNCVMRGP